MKSSTLTEGRKRAKEAAEKVGASANKGATEAVHGLRSRVRDTTTTVQKKGRKKIKQMRARRASAPTRFVRSVKQVVTTIGPRRLLLSVPAALTASWAYRRMRHGKR